MTSFVSSKRFNPVSFYPYGIARSGEYNRQQVEYLEQFGEAYTALASGERAPITEEEKRFVAVCRGECEASNLHERAWILFCKKTGSRRVASPFGSSKETNGDLNASVSSDDLDDL